MLRIVRGLYRLLVGHLIVTSPVRRRRALQRLRHRSIEVDPDAVPVPRGSSEGQSDRHIRRGRAGERPILFDRIDDAFIEVAALSQLGAGDVIHLFGYPRSDRPAKAPWSAGEQPGYAAAAA